MLYRVAENFSASSTRFAKTSVSRHGIRGETADGDILLVDSIGFQWESVRSMFAVELASLCMTCTRVEAIAPRGFRTRLRRQSCNDRSRKKEEKKSDVEQSCEARHELPHLCPTWKIK